VLRLANSPDFARGARVGDLPTAVTRIGTRRIETILEALFLHDCYRPKVARYQPAVLAIWRNSVARATAMRALAESTRVGLAPGTVYVAGLLADVGAMFLLWAASERAPELAVDEVLAFGRQRHAAIGADVLTAWKLDPSFAQLATTHHVPRNPVPASALWTLAIVAGELAERACEDVTAPERPTTADVARCLAELRAAEPDLTTAAAAIGRELDGLGAALG
jgi:HD-like signal output (HDOD) protein